MRRGRFRGMLRSMKYVRRFWQFLVAVSTRVGDGHFGLIAAGVAFYAMFAVFPGLAAAVAVWGMFADPYVISGYLDVVERFMPPEAGQLIHDQVIGLITAPKAADVPLTGLTAGISASYGGQVQSTVTMASGTSVTITGVTW